MAEHSTRVIAVDWSGNKSDAAKTMWLAEAEGGQVFRIEKGRNRDQLIGHLLDLGTCDPNLVVGFDFAFSMPKWFVEKEGATTGSEFWAIVAQKGEAWLKDCPSPFWGRKGTRKPTDISLLRRTEERVGKVGSSSASSVFQLAGGNQVGTGSIRGMPFLQTLRNAGWRIWPFFSDGAPTVIEIYPRLLMGPVIKTSAPECFEYLSQQFPSLDPTMASVAAQDDGAFDAVVSALVMAEHANILRALPAGDSTDLVEGRIWSPGGA